MDTTILLVDDAMFMRTVLKKMLEEESFKIVGEASNGNDAIRLAGQLKPDVITLDITMPDRDGINSIEEILHLSPNSRIIMCSAMGQQSMVVDAIKKGAKDFIVKPFEKARVIQAINNVIK